MHREIVEIYLTNKTTNTSSLSCGNVYCGINIGKRGRVSQFHDISSKDNFISLVIEFKHLLCQKCWYFLFFKYYILNTTIDFDILNSVQYFNGFKIEWKKCCSTYLMSEKHSSIYIHS